ncbi:metallophosphoesterase [Weissella viridescens]|uniref:Metallophosphoesterase n=1 Tax=Weissella viridescens TaxID=1629 RepID=A0A3P2RGQ2_WEIVI|nr:metallophosphoesterase family protein [Weissella viridescens]RRG18745.1 metallophosphoesterase [Weissella viridescens]
MNTTIAILSDIHGNYTALSSIIRDIEQSNIDETWFLGDLIMPGPGGDDLFDLLDEVNTTVFLRGNWDDCYFEVMDGALDFNDPSDVYVGTLVQYVHDHLSKKNVNRLKTAPISTTKEVNGLSIQLTHNLPNINYGPELIAGADTPAFEALFENQQTDIAIYGHIHHQVLRYSAADQMVVNPGSVGEPYFSHEKLGKDRRAQYAILTIDDAGIAEINFKKISYDIPKEVKRAKSANLPYSDLYQESIETGNSRVRDAALLTQLKQEHDYVNGLKKFLAN